MGSNLDECPVDARGTAWENACMNTRQATPQEAARIARIDRRALGYGVNPCQSIPPRHTLYTATNGRTYCTTCGQETTERS